MISMPSWTMVRYGLVFLTLGIVTWNYYSFSHFVHDTSHFDGHEHGEQGEHGGEHFDPDHHHEGGPDDHDHDHGDHFDPHHGGSDNHHGEQGDHGHDEHGRRGSFDSLHMKKDGLFLYGLALPLLLLTLASLIWNPSTSTKGTTTPKGKHAAADTKKENSRGDIDVRKWTIIWFVVPLVLIMLDGQRGHSIFHSNSQFDHMGWNLYVRFCMSLMSPSGYGATWALALFLIPVTKHSPILDWLKVTPVQALAFHRVAGWTSFWYSVLHGFLHLRHLMDVLNPTRTRTWFQQLKYLLVPESMWKCLVTQNPWRVFIDDTQGPYDGTPEEADQCWLALVNSTGMISVLAFVALAITSLPRVRRYSYALFYRVHIPSAWIMLIMAIWHYPTCALVLIPNIIYYLSFNIPVYVTQSMDAWRQSDKSGKPKSSPLVEANLIQGGSVELVFATTPQDRHRHESRFARISCAAISPLSHPFSVFSRDDLTQQHGGGDDSHPTVSILLRPSGPFTEKLTKALFSDSSNEDVETLLGTISEPLITPSLHYMMQVDSFYAGSFDWVDKAMISHDEILLVAGGVGIVPFLEFLPSLQQRIQMDSAAVASDGDSSSSLVDTEAFLDNDSNVKCGPDCIHLHWYCRQVGLASYVWNNYLKSHVQETWESNPASQGRLKIHLHLTSSGLDPSSTAAAGEELLTTLANSGLMEKHEYSSPVSIHQQEQGSTGTVIRPVKDAPFTQSLWLGLLLPGLLTAVGIILHWWWYQDYIVDEMFRRDNLIIRSHSVIFTLVLAIVVSVPVEHYLRRNQNAQHERDNCTDLLLDTDSPSESETTSTNSSMEKHGSDATLSTGGSLNDAASSVLTVTAGRPSVDSVICGVLKADRPGVYSCGPHAMMESVEDAVRSKRDDCAFYREDSEM